MASGLQRTTMERIRQIIGKENVSNQKKKDNSCMYLSNSPALVGCDDAKTIL